MHGMVVEKRSEKKALAVQVIQSFYGHLGRILGSCLLSLDSDGVAVLTRSATATTCSAVSIYANCVCVPVCTVNRLHRGMSLVLHGLCVATLLEGVLAKDRLLLDGVW